MLKTTGYLWTEKYRPKTVEECVLPNNIKKTFLEIVASNNLPNLLLSGPPGCGKTSVAKALCEDMGCDYMMINCSEDGNIDTLRTKIRNFASSISLSGGLKVVILDEFDYSNPQSMQPALRGFMEEFANNCRFILTCNYENKVIDPLHSRCTKINFRFNNAEKSEMCKAFYDRLCDHILPSEEIECKKTILMRLFPIYGTDFRALLNYLQKYSITSNGFIDDGILAGKNDVDSDSLISAMKSKNFADVRKWVFNNLENDQSHVFKSIYNILIRNLTPNSIPQAVVIIADYQYKSAFVADQEINLVACIVQLMVECEFV
jgi:DNA polymerase III delta prime subunit